MSAVSSMEPRADEPLVTWPTPFYRTVRFIGRATCRTYFRLRVEGLANVPATGGAVVATNHQSFLDIMLIAAALDRHVSYVARDTLAEWWWLRLMIRQSGSTLVRRGTSDRAALRGMAAHLEAGDLVAIYPEGTRTRDGKLGVLKGGAVLAARMAGVPIVPGGIRGAYEAWPRGRLVPRPKRVAIRFGPPIDSSLPDAMERLQASIGGMIGDGTYGSVLQAP